jgi:hypothetical protein
MGWVGWRRRAAVAAGTLIGQGFGFEAVRSRASGGGVPGPMVFSPGPTEVRSCPP